MKYFTLILLMISFFGRQCLAYGPCPDNHNTEPHRKVAHGSAMEAGPFKYRIVTIYDETNRLTNDQPKCAISKARVAYPEFLSPKNSETRNLNHLLSAVKPVDRCEAGGSGSSDESDVFFASTKFIIIETNSDTYCQSTPHGYSDVTYHTYLLKPKPHLMQSSDLFLPEKNWKKALIDVCVSEGKNYGIEMDKLHLETIGDAVGRIENWQVTANGLLIKMPFEMNRGHPIDNEQQDVLIPWDKLKPYLKLNPEALFD